MNINISENLKRLRFKADITQEKLASYIGVSAQAVSKWERGEGFPDIMILPTLANYFEVSVDELMGMNDLRDPDEFAAKMEEHKMLLTQGRFEEDIALLRNMLKIYPKNHAVMLELIELADHLEDKEEALALTQLILEDCTDLDIKSQAAYEESMLLSVLGRDSEALDKVRKFPRLEHCRELNIPWLLTSEERAVQCQETIKTLMWAFWGTVEQLESSGIYSPEETVSIYQKVIDMYNIIYDTRDLCYSHLRVFRCYCCMGDACVASGMIDDAFEYYAKAFDSALAFYALPEKAEFTSLLLNRLAFDRSETDTVSANLFNDLRFHMGKHAEKIGDDRRYVELLDKVNNKIN